MPATVPAGMQGWDAVPCGISCDPVSRWGPSSAGDALARLCCTLHVHGVLSKIAATISAGCRAWSAACCALRGAICALHAACLLCVCTACAYDGTSHLGRCTFALVGHTHRRARSSPRSRRTRRSTWRATGSTSRCGSAATTSAGRPPYRTLAWHCRAVSTAMGHAVRPVELGHCSRGTRVVRAWYARSTRGAGAITARPTM
jgi:hypothetical protein